MPSASYTWLAINQTPHPKSCIHLAASHLHPLIRHPLPIWDGHSSYTGNHSYPVINICWSSLQICGLGGDIFADPILYDGWSLFFAASPTITSISIIGCRYMLPMLHDDGGSDMFQHHLTSAPQALHLVQFLDHPCELEFDQGCIPVRCVNCDEHLSGQLVFHHHDAAGSWIRSPEGMSERCADF